MVHGASTESAGALMASLAGSRGLYMIAWFTHGRAAIMATGTT